ncbi:hypothetical protein ACFL6Y_01725 [Elusimicrobiota bacterium]
MTSPHPKIHALLVNCANATLNALRRRHQKGKMFTCEDSIRSYFCHELTRRKISLDDITPEYPCAKQHPKRGIDMHIELPNTDVWLEFKFHRQTQHCSASETKDLGKILADFFRLASLRKPGIKYSFYVIDAVMLRYLRVLGYCELISNAPFTVHRKTGNFYIGTKKLPKSAKEQIIKKTWSLPLNAKVAVTPIFLPAAKPSEKNEDFPYHVLFYRVA